MSRPSTFRGSTSARFVKNTKQPKKITQGYKLSKDQLVPEKANPLLNDAIQKREIVEQIDNMDKLMGFERFEHGDHDGAKPRKGWLINMHATIVPTEDYLAGYSGVDYYFLDAEGGSFKATIQYDPYFFLLVVPGKEAVVEEALKKLLEQFNMKSVSRELKEDLKLPNHLVGLQRSVLRLVFHNTSDLHGARRTLTPFIKENQRTGERRDVFQTLNFYNSDNIDLRGYQTKKRNKQE